MDPPFRKQPTASPVSGREKLAVAALTLAVVLVVCYLVVSLHSIGPQPPTQQETFRGWTQYTPACSNPWLSGRRGACKGLTTGEMPSIDESPVSWAPCCGSLGVPPPTLY